jgi:hypothetical protein
MLITVANARHRRATVASQPLDDAVTIAVCAAPA